MLNSMTDCERDVEVARAKLIKDLDRLRSPLTVSAFTEQLKREALLAKESVVEHAKEAVRTSLRDLIEDVKAKAAANPVAAIAIGAGIAWQLVRRPPVATILVGAGAYYLWRTPVARDGKRTTQDYLNEGKQRLKDQTAQLGVDASAAAGEVSRVVSQKADQVYFAGKEHIQDWSRHAVESLAGVASQVKSETEHVAEVGRHALASSIDQGGSVAVRASVGAKTFARDTVSSIGESVRGELFSPPNARDTVLLGVAGLAVAGALGIAYQKRVRT